MSNKNKMEDFLQEVCSLLTNMQVYLHNSDPLDTTTSSSVKQTELFEDIARIKSGLEPDKFLKVIRAGSSPSPLSDGNNNNNSTLIASDGQEKTSEAARHCLCSDLQDVCLVSRSLDISAARAKHFTRSLLDRMLLSENQKFALFFSDIIYKEHSGWLRVDENHRYFGVVSDCIFCLFESENSESSLMNLILNETLSQPVQSQNDQYAFTVTLPKEEILYFCASSAQDQLSWVRWLNIGNQLSYDDLLRARRREQSSRCSRTTQTVSETVDSVEGAARRRQYVGQKGSRPHSFGGTKSNRPLTVIQQTSITEEVEGETDNQKQSAEVIKRINHKIDVVDTSSLKKRTNLNGSSAYDWSRDQGMSRKYHSSEQLNGELSLKKGISFTEGRPTMPTPRQSRPRSSAMVYYTDSGLTRQSANKRSHTIAGADKPGKWGSRLLRRASSLFGSKPEGIQHSGSTSGSVSERSSGSVSEKSSVSPGSTVSRRRQDTDRSGSNTELTPTGSHNSKLSTVDMAEFCEMQGYLHCKKVLKWNSYYCCVYNGTFSCFKDVNSSLPEIQCQLKECLITPIDDKKMKRSFAFKLTPRTGKSTYFSATSEADLHAWYSVFNNYIRRALDLPMVEKTSADGASHHSDESDGSHEGSDVINKKSIHKRSGIGGKRLTRGDIPKTNSDSCNSAGILIVQQHLKEPTIMRSASESDYQKRRAGSRQSKSLSQFYCKSLDDLPSLTSSSSNSSGDEGYTDLSHTKPKRSSAEQRKHLIDKMMRGKVKIEEALQLKRQRDEEEHNNEVLANITKLQQRRVSTQLKYNYLERQLQDKKEEKSWYSGKLQRSLKQEKTLRQSTSAAADSNESNNTHIRQQMVELKHKLDELDRGLMASKSTHTSGLSKLGQSGRSVDHPTSASDSLSEQRLRGLESIIETLEKPAQPPINPPLASLTENSCSGQQNNNVCRKCSGDVSMENRAAEVLEIRPETLAVIGEFEAMTKELLSKRPSVNYN